MKNQEQQKSHVFKNKNAKIAFEVVEAVWKNHCKVFCSVEI